MTWLAVLRARCPRCLEGGVYRTFFRVHDACPRCGLGFVREPGYWVGAMYFSYGGALLAGAPVAMGLWLAGASEFAACAWASVVIAGLSPWIWRWSRVAWLHFDQRWDPR